MTALVEVEGREYPRVELGLGEWSPRRRHVQLGLACVVMDTKSVRLYDCLIRRRIAAGLRARVESLGGYAASR